MPLTLYRRHRRGCEASHAEGTFTGEFEESRRGAKRCSCGIHASGTLAGKFNRKRTGCFKWDEARAVARQWEKAGAWDGSVQPVPPPAAEPTPAAQPLRMTIAEAADAYLAKCKNRCIAPSTLAKYKTFSNQLRDYAGRFFATGATIRHGGNSAYYAPHTDHPDATP